ncbi:HNH endonuclease signature motif containing protein [Bacillus xiapuensis]|uniref:Putative HNH nuclease YajD n=1 Tax=Bacillus xiapuensis TaxID=2014075 RepID=A0ABU6NB78_9BACI|nr:HNH endonuclease signature motif containing protein [Bacillus xiapuensis]
MNRHQHYDRYKRNPESRTFYNSAAWQKCRQLALIRDNNLCQDCLSKKKLTPAEMVHHIKELTEHPELALSLDNLESLCNPCHNKRHSGREASEPKRSKKIKVVKASRNSEEA